MPPTAAESVRTNLGPKFAYKLAWLDRLAAHTLSLRQTGAPVILAGDFNVAPTEADIYQPNHWQGDALVDPQARSAFADILDQGWTDALRAVHPQGPLWTFWGYIRQRWPNDKGLRLDHLLLSPDLATRLTDAGVDRRVRGQDNASDHAPAWVDVRLPARGTTRVGRAASPPRRRAIARRH